MKFAHKYITTLADMVENYQGSSVEMGAGITKIERFLIAKTRVKVRIDINARLRLLK